MLRSQMKWKRRGDLDDNVRIRKEPYLTGTKRERTPGFQFDQIRLGNEHAPDVRRVEIEMTRSSRPMQGERFFGAAWAGRWKGGGERLK